jgi:hypothetical protein
LQLALLDRALRGRVSDRDVWYREITNTRHVDKTGRLKHAALKGRSISAPERSSSAWKSELSGRLRSIVSSHEEIRSHGEIVATKQRDNAHGRGEAGKEFQFIGIAHADARAIRKWSVDASNVMYDPRMKPKENDFDLAHSNVVFKTKPPEGILSALDDVIGGLTVTLENHLQEAPCANCGPCWRYRVLKFIFDRFGHK